MSIFACFRSKETGRDDFIFYSRRLMRLLIEDVMSMLPFKNVTIDTPQGFQYDGKRLDVKQVGVSQSHCHVSLEGSFWGSELKDRIRDRMVS